MRQAVSKGGIILFLLVGGRAQAAPTFSNGVSQGIVSVSGLSEASGIVASRNNAGVLWTHNDSGHPAVMFALDKQGRLLSTYSLPGNTDNEDIAVGPGPIANVSYLYVGDIGDNNANRASIKVYQIPEPAVYARQYTNPITVAPKGARTLTLEYPDGARNAEAMFVDPVTGDLFIFTKQSPSRVYTAPKSQLDTNDSITLAFVRTVSFNTPSAAAISPAGNEILLRRESFAQLRQRSNGQSVSDALGSAGITIPVVGTANGEPNGEAIGFDAIGSGYYTLSDDAASQPLYYFARTSADGPRGPQTLVAAGSVWKYLDNGSNQGTTWRSAGFNDFGWSNGVAPFGYGAGGAKTIVSFGPDANNKYVTTYFRKTFVADNASCLSNLNLKIRVDDGAAVFLNGSNILNFQLAANATYRTLATTAQSTNLEDTWFSFPVPAPLLVNGTNTLAVEIHQASGSDPDLGFDLQLLAAESQQGRFTSATLLPDRQLQLCLCGPDSSNVTVLASPNLIDWSAIGNATLTNGAVTFLDLNATNFDQRFYRAEW